MPVNLTTLFFSRWFHRGALLALLIIASLLHYQRAHAQALIIEFSDNHAAYNRLPNFLRAVGAIRRQFLRRHPGAPVIIIANGDYAGLSEWSGADQGWLGIRILGELTKLGSVLYVLGNHDGFDLGPLGFGNELVVQQMAALNKRGVHVLGSNFEWTQNARKYVEPHFDIQLPSGKRIRFLGYGLEDTRAKASYDYSSEERVFENVRDTAQTLAADLTVAGQDGIDKVVVFQHDSFGQVIRLMKKIKADPPKAVPHISIAFAGHDHRIHQGDLKGTFIIDSGSNYDFSRAELDEDGMIRNSFHYSAALQAVWSRRPQYDSTIDPLVKMVERWLQKPAQFLMQEVGPTAGFEQTKKDLKAGRAELGTRIADTTRAWGEDVIVRARFEKLPVLSFFNSSSYRLDKPIPAGRLTHRLLHAIYPMQGFVSMFRATGAEIEELYRVLRVDRATMADPAYSPQMSSNLEEVEYMSLIFDGRNIEPDREYYLVLDSWLSRAGTQHPHLVSFIKEHPALAEINTTELFIGYGAKTLRGSRKALCFEAYAVGGI